MGLGKWLFGATGAGVKEAAEGIGNAAKSIRTAITGDLPPELLVELERIEQKSRELQSAVNAQEAQHPSLFVAGWRPFIGWICGIGLAYAAVRPIIVWACITLGIDFPPPADTDTLVPILVGMLGLGGMRTIEKYHGVHRRH